MIKKLRTSKVILLFILFKLLPRKKKAAAPKKRCSVLHTKSDDSLYKSLLHLLKFCNEQPEFAAHYQEDLENAMAKFQLLKAQYEHYRTPVCLRQLQIVRDETRNLLVEVSRSLAPEEAML